MSWRAYRKYKSSGIAWFGQIPEDWGIRRLKYCATIVMGQSPSSDDYSYDSDGLPFLQGNAEFTEKFPLAHLTCDTATKVAPEGALLISVRAPVGALNVANRDYGIGRGLCAILVRPDALVRGFAWRLLHVIREGLTSIATGSTYEAVAAGDVAGLAGLLPSLAEQHAIAAFLNRETARLDALIEKKERQIELLQEKRSALISHAVTKGLDPNVEMKDSGIEWLGEIPEHWEVTKLKFAARVLMGQSPSSDDYSYDSEGIPFLQGNAEFTRKHPVPRVACDVAARVVPAGALLISVRAPVGALNVADRDYGIGRGLCAVLAKSDILYPEFLWYLLQITREQLLSVATGSTYEAVTADEVAALKGVIPPLAEQRAIAAFLDRETARIDGLIEKIRASIGLLREYRRALISAAVTGKIDVREETR